MSDKEEGVMRRVKKGKSCKKEKKKKEKVA